jgi:periplasmic divalent cation tolerance protein
MSHDPMLVLTTCDAPDDAAGLAEALVEARLAACVNAVPRVSSTYRWNGNIEHGEEVLLLIKTTAAQLGAVERVIKARSRYELPEVLTVRVDGGSADYLAWIGASVSTEE